MFRGLMAMGSFRPNLRHRRAECSFLIADTAVPLHRAAMTREPIGTTRKGQVLLGALGLIMGVGGGLGLETMPTTFEPILRIVLYGLGALFRVYVHYDPSERTFFAILLAALGMIWMLLLARAFIREPARNRIIDAYLMRQNHIDQARRATTNSQDDPST